MLWEELTARNFQKNVEACGGVCLLPVGVVEKHGDHLPLGTDMFTGTLACKRAAEIEPAIVFPYYFFGQIAEARHYPGTISVSHDLLMKNLIAICDEIGRNGLKKIMIISSHGGNGHFLPFFAQEMPRLDRDYSVYIGSTMNLSQEQRKQVMETAGTNDLGQHAGVTETSTILHLRPDLVHMEECDPKDSESQHRLDAISRNGLFTGFNWYANFPNHFAGDPSLATPALGETIFNFVTNNLANAIRAVKADETAPALAKEYAARAAEPKA